MILLVASCYGMLIGAAFRCHLLLSHYRQYAEWLTAFPLGRARRTPRMLYDEAGHAYAALSEKLHEQPFFFGDRPSELDAVVYGHLAFVINSSE